MYPQSSNQICQYLKNAPFRKIMNIRLLIWVCQSQTMDTRFIWVNSTNIAELSSEARYTHIHTRIQKVLSERVQLWHRFFSWWGEVKSKYHYHYIRAIIGPPTKCHLNCVSLACRRWPNIECLLGSFVIFRGSCPVLLIKSIFFCDFSGGGGVRTPCPPSSESTHTMGTRFEWANSTNMA